MKKTSFLVLVFCLFGCSSVLKPVSYDHPTRKTNKSVDIRLATGLVKGGDFTSLVPAGGVLVPVQSGSSPNLRFNEEDQKIFVDSLKNELQRLGLAKVADKIKSDRKINLIFAHTEHAGQTHRYLLDVVMLVQDSSHKNILQRKYSIDSEDGVSIWTKMNTNAEDGKGRAAKMLMEKIIPDIESVLR